MDDEWSVRTERGGFSVRDGHLQVRTTSTSVLRGVHLQKWRHASARRRGLFLFSIVTTSWGVTRLVGTTLGGGPDESLPFVLLWAGFAFVVLAFLNDVRRRNVQIPIRSIAGVERSPTGQTLRVRHGESAATDATEIEFHSETDVESAVERLRHKGIPVSKPNEGGSPRGTDAERTKAAEE